MKIEIAELIEAILLPAFNSETAGPGWLSQRNQTVHQLIKQYFACSALRLVYSYKLPKIQNLKRLEIQEAGSNFSTTFRTEAVIPGPQDDDRS